MRHQYNYWCVQGQHAIHIETGYDCYLPANLGPGYTWVDHISEKPWGHPACLRELERIMQAHNAAQLRPVAAIAP